MSKHHGYVRAFFFLDAQKSPGHAPVIWPTLAVMCVFFFVWSWNEFLYPLVLLISNENQTVPLGLAVTQGQYTSDPTAMSAAALLGVIPMVVFFLFFQRSLTRGVTAGAVK